MHPLQVPGHAHQRPLALHRLKPSQMKSSEPHHLLDLARRGHEVVRLQRIGGGMNAIAFGGDGTLTGAACWRADGTPVAIAGGLARAGVRFSSI